jgi:hypothetical protein
MAERRRSQIRWQTGASLLVFSFTNYFDVFRGFSTQIDGLHKE